MPAEVIVVHKWAKIPDAYTQGVTIVDTTTKSGWRADLSPFTIGPCELYDGHVSQNMENAWQFAKVYVEDLDKNGEPAQSYWDWAARGWQDPNPHRYPKGRGRAPVYSYWQGKKLDYIRARKEIYAPLYIEAVQKTEGYKTLQELYNTSYKLYLRDWDGWDMQKYYLDNLTEVLNYPDRRMGHAFVLAMLLTNDPALDRCLIRT